MRRWMMLEIRGVEKRFDDIEVLKGVSLSVETGSIFGLLGVNGAGKSTLLRITAGILRADKGAVSLDGLPISDSQHTRQQLFYLPDEFYYFPNATVRTMADIYESVYPEFDRARYREMYGELGFDDIRKIRTFSKGMKKQIAILLAICSQVKYILCDEIFDGLDPVIREEIQQIIEREVERRRLSLVIASHDLREIKHMCSHIGILHRGGIRLLEGGENTDDIKALIT